MTVVGGGAPDTVVAGEPGRLHRQPGTGYGRSVEPIR